MNKSEEQKEVTVDKLQLMYSLHYLSMAYKNQNSRKSRLETLMRRKKAKKWKPEKTAKMVRRLVGVTNQIEETETKMHDVSKKLSDAGVEVSVESLKNLE